MIDLKEVLGQKQALERQFDFHLRAPSGKSSLLQMGMVLME